ncbi:hypothetical protein NC651_023704 [Populus alba x Populus x berolinensis]|nr:hypothetical protein NC651_023704 [Populus alba x Populus x berolinensis]
MFEIDSPLSSELIITKVQYEHKPPRCEKCKLFGHSCPLLLVPDKDKAITPAQQTQDSIQLAALSLTATQTTNGQSSVLNIAMQPPIIVQPLIPHLLIDHNSNIQTPLPHITLQTPICRT